MPAIGEHRRFACTARVISGAPVRCLLKSAASGDDIHIVIELRRPERAHPPRGGIAKPGDLRDVQVSPAASVRPIRVRQGDSCRSSSPVRPGKGKSMLARIRKSMEEKDEGFTLIELLVVIIIIGILAAIAIPVFLNQRKKAVDASIKSDLRTVANEIETYFTDAQDYPASVTASTGMPSPHHRSAPTPLICPRATLSRSSSAPTRTNANCFRGSNPKGTATPQRPITSPSAMVVGSSPPGRLPSANAIP